MNETSELIRGVLVGTKTLRKQRQMSILYGLDNGWVWSPSSLVSFHLTGKINYTFWESKKYPCPFSCPFFSFLGEANNFPETCVWSFLFGFQFAGCYIIVSTDIGLQIEVMVQRGKKAEPIWNLAVNPSAQLDSAGPGSLRSSSSLLTFSFQVHWGVAEKVGDDSEGREQQSAPAGSVESPLSPHLLLQKEAQQHFYKDTHLLLGLQGLWQLGMDMKWCCPHQQITNGWAYSNF